MSKIEILLKVQTSKWTNHINTMAEKSIEASDSSVTTYTTGTTCGAVIAYPSGTPKFTPVFSGVRVARYLVFCAMFCRSMFGRLSFYFWPLYCPSFFELRILITPWYLQTFLMSSHHDISFRLYLTFFIQFLEFTGWPRDNCFLADSERIEKKINLKPHVFTDAISNAILLSIYKEVNRGQNNIHSVVLKREYRTRCVTSDYVCRDLQNGGNSIYLLILIEFNLIWLLVSDWLICLQQHWLYLISWVMYCDLANIFIRHWLIQIISWNKC